MLPPIWSGVWNYEIFSLLEMNGVKEIAFDYNVRSFNFMPGYQALELAEKKSLKTQILLSFEAEKDFVIVESLKNLEHFSPHLILKVGAIDKPFNRFKTPYYLRLSDFDNEMQHFVEDPLCQGVILPHEQLLFYQNSGRIIQLASILKRVSHDNFKLMIESSAMKLPTLDLCDLLGIHQLCITLDQSLLLSYRTINFELLNKSLNLIKETYL